MIYHLRTSHFWDISVKNVQVIFDYSSLVGILLYGVNLLLIVSKFILKIFHIIKKNIFEQDKSLFWAVIRFFYYDNFSRLDAAKNI